MHEAASTVPTSTLIIASLLSGFIGALLPLLITPYYNHRKRLYARTIQHANSLVLLELRLLDIGSTLYDDIHILNSIVEGADRKSMMMSRLIKLKLEDSFFNDSYSGELNQKLFDFRYDLVRINNDIDNFNRVYNILSEAVLLNKIPEGQIDKQLKGLLIEKDKLSEGLNKLLGDSEQVLGYTRVRISKDKTPLMRYRNWIIQRRVKTVTDAEVEEQVKKHRKDVAKNSEK